MISETEIMDQWTVISDCITKPDESPQALEIISMEMFTVFVTLQEEGLPTDIIVSNRMRPIIRRTHDARRRGKCNRYDTQADGQTCVVRAVNPVGGCDRRKWHSEVSTDADRDEAAAGPAE